MKPDSPIQPKTTLDWLLETVLLAALLAVAIGGLTPRAQAQVWVDTYSITNVVPATSTNTAPSGAVIDCSRVSEFGLQFNVQLQGSGTSAVTFTVANSLDQTNWVTRFTAPITASGTNVVPWVTNVITGGIPFWKITQVINANSAAVTNLAGGVLTSVKRNRD